MTYTPQQIDFIREYGNKELTEGCIVFQPEYDYTFKIPEDEWDLMVAMRNGFRWTTILEISESKVWFEILWHPVEWHNVFAKLKEEWYISDIAWLFTTITSEWELFLFRTDQSDYTTLEVQIHCNPCLSPMDQKTVIEELLKLIK